MIFYTTVPTLVMIDAYNTKHALDKAGFRMDYKRLEEFFKSRGLLRGMRFYTQYQETDEDNSFKPLLDWLEFNGYNVITKDKSRKNEEGKTRYASLVPEIITDMFMMAPHYTNLFLFTGNGEFTYPVQRLQDLGKQICVISTRADTGNISEDLRRQADKFLDLRDMAKEIGQPMQPENGA